MKSSAPAVTKRFEWKRQLAPALRWVPNYLHIPDVQVGTVLLVTTKELFHSQPKTVFKEANLEESVVEALHYLSREL